MVGALSLLVVLATGPRAAATPTVINQSGSGDCSENPTPGCDNTNPNIMANPNALQGFHDWFSFEIPATNHIIAAVLSIYESASYTPGRYPSDTWSAYHATGISYDGLIGDQTVLGTTDTGAAATGVGHYVSIVLNAAALADLNQAGGTMFVFGGAVANNGNVFGYSPNIPATLALTVPEPFSAAILGFGVVALGVARRRSHGSGT